MTNPDYEIYKYRESEYMDLLHAMQSGVAFTMGPDTEPKHLRVGVNSALITSSALVKTLVEAGLIDFEKFRDNEIELLKNEIELYKRRLSRLGLDVHLA